MIVGIGIDIVEINRIEKACKNPRFLHKLFTPDEQSYFKERKYNIETIAGRFAAKEAAVKALGTGIGKVGWLDIEVLSEKNGRPYIVLHGEAFAVLKQSGAMCVHVSISHAHEYAIAQVVIEGTNKADN